MKISVFDVITEQIIKRLEKGTLPWRQPWSGVIPRNLVTKHEYTGINLILLQSRGFKSPYFLSFLQASKLGAKVKKGSKGTPMLVYYFKSKKGKKSNVPHFQYHPLFNAEQCERLEVPKLEPKKLENPDIVLGSYKDCPQIEWGADAPGYYPNIDVLKMPEKDSFKVKDLYYATLFRELIMSTGIKKRLDRFGAKDYLESSNYYIEEQLIAELGCAFLCARFGLNNSLLEVSKGAPKEWIERFRESNGLVIGASSKASKAINYIFGENKEE